MASHLLRIFITLSTALFILSGALAEFNLTIVHITDLHSHWLEFDENGGICSADESVAGKCFGGFARQISLVRQIREKEPNVLVLSSGDFFLGRSLNALHGWKLAHALLPALGLDAMCLSNHDFDSGVFELSGFLYAMDFPVLCANMMARNTSYLYSRVNKSAVFDIGGEKIAVVGFVHPETLKKTRTVVSVKFTPEIPALQKEVERLESDGINKIIALGHSGFYNDLQIAKEVQGLDVIMGGNSDIVFYEPVNDLEKVGNIHGNYPRVHRNASVAEDGQEYHNKTLILHIPQFGKYLGVIRMTFDDDGKVIHEKGEPVLLDHSIPQDKETLDFLDYAIDALEEIAQHSRLPEATDVLGVALGEFDGTARDCRLGECSLGNLATDAILHQFLFHYYNKTENEERSQLWGRLDAAVLNAGVIRHSLEAGKIRIKDLLHSFFVGDTVKRIYMSGKQVKNMLEHSVRNYDPAGITSCGSFLQVAGLRVVYNVSKPVGQRVNSLVIRCRNCSTIECDCYEPVNPYRTYAIVMPEFLMMGGDGYESFEDPDAENIGHPDILLVTNYLESHREVKPVLDGRISFLDKATFHDFKSTRRPNVITPNILPIPPVATPSMKDNEDSRQYLMNIESSTPSLKEVHTNSESLARETKSVSSIVDSLTNKFPNSSDPKIKTIRNNESVEIIRLENSKENYIGEVKRHSRKERIADRDYGTLDRNTNISDVFNKMNDQDSVIKNGTFQTGSKLNEAIINGDPKLKSHKETKIVTNQKYEEVNSKTKTTDDFNNFRNPGNVIMDSDIQIFNKLVEDILKLDSPENLTNAPHILIGSEKELLQLDQNFDKVNASINVLVTHNREGKVNTNGHIERASQDELENTEKSAQIHTGLSTEGNIEKVIGDINQVNRTSDSNIDDTPKRRITKKQLMEEEPKDKVDEVEEFFYSFASFDRKKKAKNEENKIINQQNSEVNNGKLIIEDKSMNIPQHTGTLLKKNVEFLKGEVNMDNKVTQNTSGVEYEIKNASENNMANTNRFAVKSTTHLNSDGIKNLHQKTKTSSSKSAIDYSSNYSYVTIMKGLNQIELDGKDLSNDSKRKETMAKKSGSNTFYSSTAKNSQKEHGSGERTTEQQKGKTGSSKPAVDYSSNYSYVTIMKGLNQIELDGKDLSNDAKMKETMTRKTGSNTFHSSTAKNSQKEQSSSKRRTEQQKKDKTDLTDTSNKDKITWKIITVSEIKKEDTKDNVLFPKTVEFTSANKSENIEFPRSKTETRDHVEVETSNLESKIPIPDLIMSSAENGLYEKSFKHGNDSATLDKVKKRLFSSSLESSKSQTNTASDSYDTKGKKEGSSASDSAKNKENIVSSEPKTGYSNSQIVNVEDSETAKDADKSHHLEYTQRWYL